MKQLKNSQNEYTNLEKQVKELKDLIEKLKKDKENAKRINGKLIEDLNKIENDIAKTTYKLNSDGQKEKEEKETNVQENPNISLKRDQISKLLGEIQKNYNSSLQEKLKTNIDQLINYQISMKINYLIIRKLEVDKLLDGNAAENSSFFENLKHISKMGKLNYLGMKNCGPILVFRINSKTQFSDIKKKCCSIWGLTEKMFTLYDDGFNNLECCYNSSVTEFFNCYSPVDKTFNNGEVCFYLFDKIKNQKELLEPQEKSIDTKSDRQDSSGDNGTSNMDSQFEECLNDLKSGKLLRGINSYMVSKTDSNFNYIRTAKMFENNIIFILITALLILFSFFSIANKKDIYNWSAALQENKITLEAAYANNNLNKLQDHLKNFIAIINSVSAVNSSKTSSIIFGLIQFRFMATVKKECMGSFTNNTLLQKLMNFQTKRKLICLSKKHEEEEIDKTIKVFSYSYNNATNIEHYLSTPIASYDNTGIIARFSSNSVDDYKNNMNILNLIANETNYNSNYYLNDQIQAIELTYTYYSPSLDIFIANLMLVEKDMNNNPLITIVDSVPFLTDVYETNLGSTIYILDVIRLICAGLLISTIFIRIREKYVEKTKKKTKDKKNKQQEVKIEESKFTLIRKIIISTIFSPKNLILLLGFSFYFVAYRNYTSYLLKTEEVYKDTVTYRDLYQFAKNQKYCRTLDLLSLYFFGLYSIKYLQYISAVQILLRAFKKSAFEYFAILASIAVIFLGLSILTNFVFGSYIYEYKNFLDSLIMNLKVFIFVENSTITSKFMEYYRLFSIIVLILFVFLIKYFSLNLFLPVLVEYYRSEYENDQNEQLLENKSDEEGGEENKNILTWKDKLKLMVWPYNYKNDGTKNKQNAVAYSNPNNGIIENNV